MCGIVGIVAKNNVNQELYDALTILQHRGHGWLAGSKNRETKDTDSERHPIRFNVAKQP